MKKCVEHFEIINVLGGMRHVNSRDDFEYGNVYITFDINSLQSALAASLIITALGVYMENDELISTFASISHDFNVLISQRTTYKGDTNICEFIIKEDI